MTQNPYTHLKKKRKAKEQRFYLKVTVRPSTRSKRSHLKAISRRPLAPVLAECIARCRQRYHCFLKIMRSNINKLQTSCSYTSMYSTNCYKKKSYFEHLEKNDLLLAILA